MITLWDVYCVRYHSVCCVSAIWWMLSPTVPDRCKDCVYFLDLETEAQGNPESVRLRTQAFWLQSPFKHYALLPPTHIFIFPDLWGEGEEKCQSMLGRAQLVCDRSLPPDPLPSGKIGIRQRISLFVLKYLALDGFGGFLSCKPVFNLIRNILDLGRSGPKGWFLFGF